MKISIITSKRRDVLCAVYAGLAALTAGFPAAVYAQPAPLNSLDPANLAKPRPSPPFDLTGTWRMVRDRTTGDYEFTPLPKFTPAAQAEYDAMLKAKDAGLAYKDDAADCYPPGMPRFMTRVWPMQVIQLPTMVVMIQGFENLVRWVYTDGRGFTPPDEVVESFNGESIGRWEGDTLVVETRGLRGAHHWMQQGVPVSNQLRIVERIRMLDGGKAFEVQFTFTDPKNWEGEWVNTKRFERTQDEVEANSCILAEMRNLPSSSKVIR